MKKQLHLTVIMLISIIASTVSKAQKNSTEQNPAVAGQNLTISMEFRPRTELRRGYRSLPSDSCNVAFFTSHRARINLDYQRKNFIFHTSLQDVRVWGDTDPRDAGGKAHFYEFYVEPSFNEQFSVRIGRQRIKYDNERLFAENDWRQAGGKHDAVRFIYNTGKLNVDLIGAYNQTKENEFGTIYDIAWDNYRALIANFIRYQLSPRVVFTAINFGDEYTDPASGNTVGHWKFTDGGRIEYNNKGLLLTFAGYYQHGKIETGEKLSAYYLEPEVRWAIDKKYSIRAGAQIISGDNNDEDGISHSFMIQYGAFHRFNGRMDYTQKTIRTYNHEGIINPYVIQDFKLDKKFSVSWESHILETHQPLTTIENDEEVTLKQYFGWENDFRFRYKANEFTDIELAYMFLTPGETLEHLRNGQNGSTHNIPQFAYLMITWTPKLFNWNS